MICFGALMSTIDTTVINVALNTLERDLHSSVAGVQWVMTGYLLSVAGVIPVSGWASRRFGARRVYVFALAMFALSSALCAAAGSLPMLVICRVLQGVAGGLMIPLGQLIAAEVAGPDKVGRVLSRIWVVSSVGGTFGPTLGGLIMQGLGWRWIFLINVPVGLVATVAAFYLLPQMPARKAGRLDVGGLLRLTIGVPAIVFALAQAEATGSVIGLSTLIPFVTGVLLICDFVRHALRTRHPLLDVRLFKRPTSLAGFVSICLLDFAWFGMLVLLPLYFQQVRHGTVVTAGLLLIPQGAGTAVGMWIAGRCGVGARGRAAVVTGALALVLTTGLFAILGPHASFCLLCPVLVVSGVAGGMTWMPAIAMSYVGLKHEQISHASPLVAVMMRLGASFGTAVAAILLQLELSRGSAKPHAAHVAWAFRASFVWETVAATIVLLLVAVLLRRSATAPEQHANLAGDALAQPAVLLAEC
ncbi:MAG TPA: DHA2 family efflux MFS transporter permease subunit [Solirubrobacteraceae bacterium]|nr:DHA2 family efflux MFS transporter permease subunit [Solirubrobacteraceae bacterium]